MTTIKITAGDEIVILPEWQDEGDNQFRFIATEDATGANYIRAHSIHRATGEANPGIQEIKLAHIAQVIPSPKPVLKPGAIYSADNGRRICLECAGASAKFTGRDRSGMRVARMPRSENAAWRAMFDRDLACECGKTSYGSAK